MKADVAGLKARSTRPIRLPRYVRSTDKTDASGFDTTSRARKSVEMSLDAADTSVRATSVGGL
jgi:hypothetical protein